MIKFRRTTQGGITGKSKKCVFFNFYYKSDWTNVNIKVYLFDKKRLNVPKARIGDMLLFGLFLKSNIPQKK
ncbi:MAG TPA: hypothetical protein DCS93_24945 [Microscillaceae bacterium]|nr:hypothetical protein [Microscillaceae bacterium]